MTKKSINSKIIVHKLSYLFPFETITKKQKLTINRSFLIKYNKVQSTYVAN